VGEQVVHGDDQARRAEAALHRALVHEGLLHRGEAAVRAEALDGGDLPAGGRRRQHQARAHEHAVDEHGARAALALLAGCLGAGQAEPLAQDVEQALAQPGVADLVVLAVDPQHVVLVGGDAHRWALRRPGPARTGAVTAVTGLVSGTATTTAY
jgi:hypothetical protein